jgi:post-segregation antitoxin (ccd killing protein)
MRPLRAADPRPDVAWGRGAGVLLETFFWSRSARVALTSRRAGKQRVCILCVVTRLNVYLPDELAAEAKKAGLNLSAVTQEAVRRALAERSTDVWLATVATTAATQRVPHDRAVDALDAERDEAPTRHG